MYATVHFRETPLAIHNGVRILKHKRKIERALADFRRDLSEICKGTEYRIRHELKVVLHAALVTIPDDERIVRAIRRLPYVADVEIGPQSGVVYHSDCYGYVEGLRALWDIGASGQGVKMGHVDGMFHPSAYSGFRGLHNNLAKFTGGWDFRNNPPTQFTISEASGGPNHAYWMAAVMVSAVETNTGTPYAYGRHGELLRGAASHISEFRQYVVANGSSDLCPPDTMAACIEKAFEEGVQVMNLSIGATKWDKTYNAGATAIDNAVTGGMNVVSAVGNTGVYFGTRAPAVASKCIGVGGSMIDFKKSTCVNPASNLTCVGNAQIYADGAAGLVWDTYEQKPDVLSLTNMTPPQDKYGLWLGVLYTDGVPTGRYSGYGGTSTAAASASGAVACLLSARPTWTPAIIKAAIMQTARRLPQYNNAQQGAGLIRVDKAYSTPAVMLPPEGFSFRLVDSTKKIFVKEQVITLKDLSGSVRTWSLGILNLETGARFVCIPDSVQVPANGEATFRLRLILDNALYTNAGSGPQEWATFGSAPPGISNTQVLLATSGSDTLTAPLTFFKQTSSSLSDPVDSGWTDPWSFDVAGTMRSNTAGAVNLERDSYVTGTAAKIDLEKTEASSSAGIAALEGIVQIAAAGVLRLLGQLASRIAGTLSLETAKSTETAGSAMLEASASDTSAGSATLAAEQSAESPGLLALEKITVSATGGTVKFEAVYVSPWTSAWVFYVGYRETAEASGTIALEKKSYAVTAGSVSLEADRTYGAAGGLSLERLAASATGGSVTLLRRFGLAFPVAVLVKSSTVSATVKSSATAASVKPSTTKVVIDLDTRD